MRQRLPGECCTAADLRGFPRLAPAYARFCPGDRTANAVGVYAPPGFKSRSLRSPVRVEACSDFQLCG